MKIDINKQYKTSDGQPVKIYTTEHEGVFPVVGGNGGDVYEWSVNGKHPYCRDLNLIEVKPEQVVFVVVDDDGDPTGWNHKEDALDVRVCDGGTLYRVVLTDDMVVET